MCVQLNMNMKIKSIIQNAADIVLIFSCINVISMILEIVLFNVSRVQSFFPRGVHIDEICGHNVI